MVSPPPKMPVVVAEACGERVCLSLAGALALVAWAEDVAEWELEVAACGLVFSE